MSAPVLSVQDLTVGYTTPEGEDIALVQDVSLEIGSGKVLCLVGESGSGKSLTSLAIMGLLPAPLEVWSGSITYRGQDLLAMSDAKRREMRGRDLAMIFQDPMTALNPVRRVGYQIGRTLALHQPHLSRAKRMQRVHELLADVGVPQPEVRAKGYPHEWSGGMRQRAVIAMAMANQPDLLLADEPTTALDTTVQAQVMEALAEARAQAEASMMLITHDMGLVAQAADEVAIMYSGRIVESGSVTEVFDAPQHPYTRGLLASILSGPRTGDAAFAIPGTPPLPAERPTGCAFAPRCTNPAKNEHCAQVIPLLPREETHPAACHHLEKAAQTTPAGAAV